MEAAAGTAAPTTAAAEGATRSGSSSDEAKPKSKSKSRSQSRKRSSIFGTLLGKKEEHDDKKEMKKEEKEEKKELKKEQKEEKVEHKAEEKAIKHEVKKEDKAEKKAEKEESKLEQKEASHESTGTSGHMDAAAIGKHLCPISSQLLQLNTSASRVVGAPLATEGESAPATTGAIENTSDVTSEAQPTSNASTMAGTTSRDVAPKANKRGSIFGNFFNKKDASSSAATETAPAVPAKDETPTTASTAPQTENPVSPPTEGTTTTTNEPSAVPNEVTSSPVNSSANPDTTKPQRRTSFFNNLGTKKEKRSEAISDAEGTDGEGKKSTGSKLGGLFRKPSRAVASNNTKTEPATPGTGNVTGVEGTPAPISKEEPAATNGNDIVPEATSRTEPQQTPVQASA